MKILQNSAHRTKTDDPSTWQRPERVADHIVPTLFTSKLNNPHVVVDFLERKVEWLVISSIPWIWSDALKQNFKGV